MCRTKLPDRGTSRQRPEETVPGEWEGTRWLEGSKWREVGTRVRREEGAKPLAFTVKDMGSLRKVLSKGESHWTYFKGFC